MLSTVCCCHNHFSPVNMVLYLKQIAKEYIFCLMSLVLIPEHYTKSLEKSKQWKYKIR